MDKKNKITPYIPASKNIPEFTFKAVFLGIIFGIIFAIGNAYLGLKTGTTVSASIPAAILAMGFLKIFFKKYTILECNITQTIATVGEGLAGGVIFTIPALMFLGNNPSIYKIFILSTLGGILGILFMIPMRRYIIVQEHGKLPFPEGTACAEILKAGESGNASALTGLWGFLIGIFYKVCTNIFYVWEELPSWVIKPFQKTIFSIDATPALLGIGYIIGPRISSMMFAGGAVAWWVIIPLIKLFGSQTQVIYPSTIPVSLMSATEIWDNYVRYIGAGAVAVGGLFSLLKIGPIIYKTIHVGIKELLSGFKHIKKPSRTDKDISMAWLILGSLAIVITLWLIPIAEMNFITIILLVTLGFFFVAVTSITVGLVGSSSNPASGMTITTLLITCLIFVSLGWTERVYLIAAITMGSVATIAITLAATTSQDLKTGFLLGATPKKQQIAEIIGIILPSLALGSTLYILNDAYQLGSIKMPAPQATLMSLIAKGVISGNLPYTLVIIGIILGIFIGILKIPILPVAMGLYLPLSLSTATMVGGLIAYLTGKYAKDLEAKEKGILLSSGLIGGDACSGVIIAFLVVMNIIPPDKKTILPPYFSLIMFAFLALLLVAFMLKPTSRKYQQK
jgi:putative OPT family oligopeptide transporter